MLKLVGIALVEFMPLGFVGSVAVAVVSVLVVVDVVV